MERLINLLQEVKDGVDFAAEKGLVTDGILESMDLVMIVSAIEEVFEIEIPFDYVRKANFENVDAMWAMIRELTQ